jgi:thiol-disulfide isomerase/thioredoxin
MVDKPVLPTGEPERPVHSAKLGIAVLILILQFALPSTGLVFANLPDNKASITFSGNLEKTLVRAKKSRTPVMVAFFAVWCPYCEEMRKMTLRAPEVLEVAGRFEWVEIDLDRNHSLARQYDVQAVPDLRLLDPDGNQRARMVGRVGPVDFREFLLESVEKLEEGEGRDLTDRPAIRAYCPKTPLQWTPDGCRGRSICFSNIGYGPLKLPSHSPLQALRLGLVPRAPSTLSRGQKEVRAAASWVNIWNVPEREYFFDYEMLLTTATFDYGISDTLQVGIGAEIRSRFGGKMDNFIQGFHDLFGIGQNDRDLAPKGAFTFEIEPSDTRPGVTLTSDDRGIFSRILVGTLQHNVTCGTARLPAFSYAVTARVEVGDSDDLQGGDALDIGVSVSLSRRLGDFYAYGTLGYARFGRERFRGIELRDHQLTGLAALEWRFAPRMSLLIQYLITEGVAKSLGQISRASHEVIIGLKGEIRERTVLEIGLIENVVNLDNSPDFGLHEGVTHRF